MAACSCATTSQGKAHDALKIAAVSYDASMSVFGAMYKAGNLSEEDKTTVLAYSARYRLAHRAAREALKTYIEVKDSGGSLEGQQELIDAAISSVLKVQSLLAEYLALKKLPEPATIPELATSEGG